ncbi:MAG: hypothetical protein ACE5IO_03680 [Thermoplasmata archaeon]
MNESILRKLAISFMIALLVAIPILIYLVVATWVAQRFAETAFLIGISFVLVGEIVYFFERAFAPGEIWRTRDGFKVGLIKSNSGREESSSSKNEESASRMAKNQ